VTSGGGTKAWVSFHGEERKKRLRVRKGRRDEGEGVAGEQGGHQKKLGKRGTSLGTQKKVTRRDRGIARGLSKLGWGRGLLDKWELNEGGLTFH